MPKPPKPEGVPPSPRHKERGGSPPTPPRHVRMEATQWRDVTHEMDNSNDRTAAIVAAGFVEHNLAVAILTRLRELTPDQQKTIFEGQYAVLNAFSAKIQIGFALGLLNVDVKKDLDALRRVRNEFAHRLDVRSFDHDDVKDECDSLIGPKYLAWAAHKPIVPKRRDKFLNTAAHLIDRFALEARYIKRPVGAQMMSYEVLPEAYR